jgi:hypothetical protein
MLPRECPGSTPTPRSGGAAPVLAAILLALAAPAAPQSILPPDSAVKAYQAGVDAARRKDWQAVVQRMDEALATGHQKPRRNFGTNRFSVDLYDPYYYRGVARMELGEDEFAREDLQRSRDAGVIQGAPEFSDLVTRLAALDRQAEEAAAALRAAAAPTPLPTAPPVPTAATAATPTSVPVRPETSAAGAERILTLFSAGDFDGAEAALAVMRAARPEAREADLLQCLVLGTRYVLDGGTDPAMLARARRALGSWRDRGGSKRTEEALLSPSLRATLSGP